MIEEIRNTNSKLKYMWLIQLSLYANDNNIVTNRFFHLKLVPCHTLQLETLPRKACELQGKLLKRTTIVILTDRKYKAKKVIPFYYF